MSQGQPDLHRRAFRETANPAIIADTQFVVTDVNDAVLELTGYDREELIGSTPQRLIDDESVYEAVVDALAAGESWVGDFESTTRDGRLVYARGSATPLVVDDETHGYVAVFTDVTRHRRYEESLRILNRVLRHNLRNDANVVLGHIERVSERLADDSLEQSLETAADRVSDMLDRARTTRRFSGILAGGNAGSLKPVDLGSAVAEALDDAPTRHVSVSVSGTDDRVAVLGDEMLAPALRAVVENAVEHNDKQVPSIDIEVTETDERVVLSIADNGPGIDPGRHDEVLGRRECTQVEHGEGLSLFFVDRLMEMYGGEVRVRENDPDGTVFDLHFRRPGAEPAGGPRPSDPTQWFDGEATSEDPVVAPREVGGGVTSVDGGERSGGSGRPGGKGGGGASAREATGARSGDVRPEAPPAESDVRDPPDAPGEKREQGGHGADAGATRRAGSTPGDPAAGEPATADRSSASATAPDPSGADLAGELATSAVGASVTPARLRGGAGRLPAVADALSEYDQPHHLLTLRRSGGLVRGDETLLRGDAAAVVTDDVVLVVADGPDGGEWTLPFASLVAVGRRGDEIVLDGDGESYRLCLPRTCDEEEYVREAVAFLGRELRR